MPNLNFNFNWVEKLDGYILNIHSHPPNREVRNDLWNEAYNIFNLSLFCINFVLVHPSTRLVVTSFNFISKFHSNFKHNF